LPVDVVVADDEEAVGVERLAGPDHVVPPTEVVRLAGIGAGNVMRSVQRVTDQHGVRARRIQFPIRFVGDLEFGQQRAARQFERLGEARLLRSDDHCCSRSEKPVQLCARTGFGGRLFSCIC
jgi:hypothetical protein